MATDVSVTKREIIGTPTYVFVNEAGMFAIYGETDNQVDRQQLLGRGETLDKAVTSARAELTKRRVEVELPFVSVRGVEGVATKRHGKNGTIMARIKGRSEQVDVSTKVFKADTPTEVIEEYIEAQEQQMERYKRLRQIENQHTVRLSVLLDVAVAAKAAGN